MKKKYYVNVFYPDTTKAKYGTELLGLFTNNKWSAEGTFCGYYGSEYYNDTTLIWTVVIEAQGILQVKKFLGKPQRINIQYDRVRIFSGIIERVIKARNDKQAFIKFSKKRFK